MLMMRPSFFLSSLLIGGLLVAMSTPVFAAEPFAELAELTKERVRWAGSKHELASSFNAERDCLGQAFESAVIKFAGHDCDRAYWCGLFLTEDGYLQKRSPQRLLAVALWENAVLVASERAPPGTGELRPLHTVLAIQYARLGFEKSARHHKACALYLFKELGEGGPAVSAEDFELFDSLKPLESSLAGRKVSELIPLGRYKLTEENGPLLLLDTTDGRLYEHDRDGWKLRNRAVKESNPLLKK
jgi:hypothetical protein